MGTGIAAGNKDRYIMPVNKADRCSEKPEKRPDIAVAKQRNSQVYNKKVG